MVDWSKLTKEDSILITQIVNRALDMTKLNKKLFNFKDFEMDLSACHLSNPLDLKGLLAANDADFGHDVFGIVRFLNRQTGELSNCFNPRYSKPEEKLFFEPIKNIPLNSIKPDQNSLEKYPQKNPVQKYQHVYGKRPKYICHNRA